MDENFALDFRRSAFFCLAKARRFTLELPGKVPFVPISSLALRW